MYNPASIVNMRSNISFNQPQPSSASSPHLPLRTSGISLNKALDARGRLPNGVFEAYSPPLLPEVDAYSVRIGDYATRSVDSKLFPTCEGCYQVEMRVKDLEEELLSTCSKLESFETEVLEILRLISEDVHVGKRSGTKFTESLHLSTSRSKGTCPPLLNLSSARGARSIPSDRSHKSRCDNQIHLTREGIADACIALERLIADARRRV